MPFADPAASLARADYLTRAPDGGKDAIAACRHALQLDPEFTPARKLLEQLPK